MTTELIARQPTFFTQFSTSEDEKSFPLQKRTRTDPSIDTKAVAAAAAATVSPPTTSSTDTSIIIDESSLEGAAAQLVALKELFSNNRNLDSNNDGNSSRNNSDSSEIISCSSNSENESPIKQAQGQGCKEISKVNVVNAAADTASVIARSRKRPAVYEFQSKRKRRKDEKLGVFKVKIVSDLSIFTIPPNKKRVFEYQFD